MLDSTNRPKGKQRRLARKKAQAANQSAQQSGTARTRPESNAGRRSPRPQAAPAGADSRRLRRMNPASPQARTQPRIQTRIQTRIQDNQSAPQPGRLPGTPSGDSSYGDTHPLRTRPPERINPRFKARLNPQGDSPAHRDQRSEPARRLGRTAAAAGTATLVAKSHQNAKSDLRVQPKSRPARPASPLVHLCRLLILGVGVGAIVGTVISVWNPALRSPAADSRAGAPTVPQPLTPNRAGNVPGTLATVSGVRMGRELSDLGVKVTPLTRDLTDLVPGIFLLDLDNGDYFSFNGSTAFSAASMIKVPILIAFLQDVDAGKVKLDEVLTMQQADLAEGSGDMQYAETGTQYTALDTATNMIIHSDNTATNMIVRRLGGNEVVNQRFQQWGLQQTLMRKPLPDLEGLNTTSPKELVSLMALLNEGKLVSMKSRDRAFDIMRRTVTDTLLPSVLAPGTTIAHKTGDIGSLVGDVGVVDLPSGRRYAIAVAVKRPHNDSRAQDLIRQVAAVVYEQFGGQPTLVPSPVAAPPAQLAPGVNPAQPGMAPIVPGAAPGAMPGAVPNAVPGTAIPGSLPGAVAPAPIPEAVNPEAVNPEAVNPETVNPSAPYDADPEAVPSADGEAGAV